MQRRTLLTTALSALAAMTALAAPALAQDNWPSKTIRFVVPYPPGGPTDLMARLLQGELTKRLGVAVVVDNKSGAGGNLGSAEVAKQAPADGHTLLLAASGPMAVNPTLYRSMPFNPLTDLAPVIQISSFPLVLEVNPNLGVKSVKELITLAKQSKTLSFASAGNGTPPAIIDKLNSTLNAIFKEPEFRTKWEAIGTPVVAGSAAAFGELIRRDTVRLGKVVKDSGATVD